MDKYIDERFERLERALANLTDSIANYTPQPAAAHELMAADRALADGLQQLQIHQNNYALIVRLRAESDALDAQIRDTLNLLWTTRRDMSSVNITTFPELQHHDVNWEELLSYARRISKTTLPAPSILSAAAAAANGTATGINGEDGGMSTGDAAGTPNTATAAPTPAPGVGTPAAVNGMVKSPAPSAQIAVPLQQVVPSGTALPDDWNRFLDPLTDMTFQPWPTEDKIRSGALAALEELAMQGIDPRGFDPAEEEARRQREEEERRVQEEREAREREDNLRKMREDQARIARERQRERERAQEEALRRGSMGGPTTAAEGLSPTTAQPARKQFQFMGDMDDDDDD
ncbi:vitamin-D-receptor interacting mediator subunit 4-domain-containing protein [Coniella lustricola]|uniref:Mediator of RNA polymerase II transcription subunit 4 n=1 Tax=Coniella lustricola TaxID=2025994 RepID=A0A2T3ANE4_9PEZI|nr:vitamin-D-receptor interacting mediator subunit 4-domain-containing protein [Coniella lustricola]